MGPPDGPVTPTGPVGPVTFDGKPVGPVDPVGPITLLAMASDTAILSVKFVVPAPTLA